MKWKWMNMKYEWNENEYVNSFKIELNMKWYEWGYDNAMEMNWTYDMKLNCKRKWYECEYDNVIEI